MNSVYLGNKNTCEEACASILYVRKSLSHVCESFRKSQSVKR